jgi:adenylate cyclase class 2
MKPEIEAKFLNVDHDALREKLQKIGAELVTPMRLMKRKNFDYPDNRLFSIGGWVRVRDEGNGKITMSYKQLNDRSLEGTHEVQLTIDSFDSAESFLDAIGLESKSYQETKRESWRLKDFEIELDEWPWSKPYIEIEGPDEASLKELAEQLNLNWDVVCHGSVEIVYQAEYDVSDEVIDQIPVFRFEDETPRELLEKKRA